MLQAPARRLHVAGDGPPHPRRTTSGSPSFSRLPAGRRSHWLRVDIPAQPAPSKRCYDGGCEHDPGDEPCLSATCSGGSRSRTFTGRRTTRIGTPARSPLPHSCTTPEAPHYDERRNLCSCRLRRRSTKDGVSWRTRWRPRRPPATGPLISHLGGQNVAPPRARARAPLVATQLDRLSRHLPGPRRESARLPSLPGAPECGRRSGDFNLVLYRSSRSREDFRQLCVHVAWTRIPTRFEEPRRLAPCKRSVPRFPQRIHRRHRLGRRQPSGQTSSDEARGLSRRPPCRPRVFFQHHLLARPRRGAPKPRPMATGPRPKGWNRPPRQPLLPMPDLGLVPRAVFLGTNPNPSPKPAHGDLS